MLEGLLLAWFLSIFGVDRMVVEVLQSFMPGIKFTVSHYYILFVILGLIYNARLID